MPRKYHKKKADIKAHVDQSNTIDDITVKQSIDQYANSEKGGGDIKQDADNKAVVVVYQNNDADIG